MSLKALCILILAAAFPVAAFAIGTVQVPGRPEHPPLHPPSRQPGAGVARRRSGV